MTSYAFHLETRRASIWAVAPSVGAAQALIAAYRDAAGLSSKDVMRDRGPLLVAPEDSALAGFAIGTSWGLYVMRRARARRTAPA